MFVFNAKSHQINVTSVAGNVFVYDGLALSAARGEANDIKRTALTLCFVSKGMRETCKFAAVDGKWYKVALLTFSVFQHLLGKCCRINLSGRFRFL